MIAGTLEIQMMASLARISDDMSKAKGIVGDAVRDIEKLMGIIGVGFSADKLIEKINSVIERMAKLNDASEKTGVSVESLSKLQFFADASGSNIDSVTNAMAKLSKGMVSTGNASAPFSEALKFIGLTAKDSSGNLKGADVLYGEIAQKLSGYADGAGKMAIAQALMGKAGADQLQTMKKMIELGAVQASVTEDQAKAADDYQIQVALLEQKNTILWNGIASKLLPFMSDFLMKLKEIATYMSGMGDIFSPIINAIIPAIKVATAYFAIFVAAPAIYTAVAGATVAVVDALMLYAYNAMFSTGTTVGLNVALFGTSVSADLAAGSLTKLKLAGSILFAAFAGWETGKWLRDNFVEARIAGLAFVGVMLTGLENLTYWAKLAGAAIVSLIPGTESYTEASARITAAHKKELASIDDNIVGLVQYELTAKAVTKAKEDDAKKPLNFHLGDPKLAAAELKLYESAVKSLSDKLGNLLGQSESEKLAFELYGKSVTMADGKVVHLTGSLEKLSPEHKKMLPILAAEIDARKNIQEVLKAEIAYRTALDTVMNSSQAITNAAILTGRDQIEQYKFETDLIGKTTDQIALLNAQRKIDLDYKQQLRALGDVYTEGGPGLDAAILKLDAATQALRDGLIPAMEKRIQLDRDWATGSQAAYSEYVDNSTNAAKQSHEAWTNAFNGMQDMLTNFFMTGKLGVKSFITLIEQQLARLAAQQFVVNIVGNVTGGAAASGGGMLSSAGGSALGSVAGSMFGAGGLGGAFSAGAGWMTGASTLSGSITAATSLMGTAGGMMSGLTMMAGTALPFIGVALAVASLLSSSKGGPKTEGGYSPNGLGIAGIDAGGSMQGSQRGDVSAAQSISQGISDSYATLASQLGLVNQKLDVGVFFAKDPAGTSNSQLQITSSAGYNRGALTGGIENVGRSDDEFKAAVTDATSQLLLQALKTSDLAQQYKDILNSIADTANAADIKVAVDHVTAARTQELSLTEQLYQLTHTDAEKMLRTREAERAAVDPLNASLLERVYALQDEKIATDAAVAAAAARQTWQDKLDVLTGATTDRALSLQHDLASTTDAATQALIRRVYALQDEKTATDAATQSANASIAAGDAWMAAQIQASVQADQAAKAARDSWAQTAKSIEDSMAALRGELVGTSGQSFASVQSQFAIATAQAKAGDQKAADSLPALVKSLQTLALSASSTNVDYQRIISATLGSLGGVLGTARISAGLPSFDVGSAYIPQDMTANIHRGERIWTAAENSDYGASMGALVEEVQGLRGDLTATREHVRKMYLQQFDWSRNGVPVVNQPGTVITV